MKTFLVAFPVLASLFLVAKADTVEIPTTSFNSYTDLEKYWNYLYPWGSDHNGGTSYVEEVCDLLTSTSTI